MTHPAPHTNNGLDKFEEDARAKWNASADQYNQWDDLGQDEKDALIDRERQDSQGSSSSLSIAPAAAASPAVALDDDGLPPLPEPTWCDCNPVHSHVYPKDEVLQIRREAVAAAVEPHMVRCDEMRDALHACKQKLATLEEEFMSGIRSTVSAIVREVSELASSSADNGNGVLSVSRQDLQAICLRNITAMPRVDRAPAPAYCRPCQEVGMSNCGNFDECDGATCSTCHRPLNTPTQAPAETPSAAEKDVWHGAAILPANSDDVLVELKPKRKGSKPRYAVAAYCREEKGVHEGEPGWFDTNSEDVDVVRWKLIDAGQTPGADSYQQRVKPWMLACFGAKISADKTERNHRFFEEATELVQACGMSQSEAHQLVDYVYGRPIGEKVQEVGGVMITLAALCLAQDIDMQEAGEIELTRIWTKVEQIRKKQAAKPKHSALPVASSLADNTPYVVHMAWVSALDEAAKICVAEDGPHRMVAGYCADRILALKDAPPAILTEQALYKAIMAIDCDDSKANDEYSDRRTAYGAGHLHARRAAATLIAPRGAARKASA